VQRSGAPPIGFQPANTRRPDSPPAAAIYPPTAMPGSLQRKPTGGPAVFRPVRATASAPAAYRPSNSLAMQPKKALSPPSVYRPGHGVLAAPAVYRPNTAPLLQPKQEPKRSSDQAKTASPRFVQAKLSPPTNSQPPVRSSLPSARNSVVQPLFEISPTDVDPINGPTTSAFLPAQFPQIWNSLANTNFRTTLIQNPAVRANFTHAFIDNALAAAQPDVPTLAVAIVHAVAGASIPIRNALLQNVGDLELALGTHAHTNAGGGDIAHFRALMNAGGVVPSRRKGAPNTMSLLALTGADLGTATALNHVIAAVTNRNNALNTVTDYVAGWTPRSRASEAFIGIRSAHQNGAGWLLQFTAGAAVLEAALLARANIDGLALQGTGKPNKVAMGIALVNAFTAAAQASDVEVAVDASGDVSLQNYFYRTLFWTAVPTKANRVLLAWARYATDSGAIANCPYIEFAGGGWASRFIWDYVNDRFFLSAHYNWVDGFNPFFQITGTPATF
jgi:hypothetical protein